MEKLLLVEVAKIVNNLSRIGRQLEDLTKAVEQGNEDRRFVDGRVLQ